jgi:hypothetical protein
MQLAGHHESCHMSISAPLRYAYNESTCITTWLTSSLQVLQEFIKQEFKDLPGSTFVDRGRYLIWSMQNNKPLNEENWRHSITPGAKVTMSVLTRKRLGLSNDPNKGHCPAPSCSGTWKKSSTQSLATWYDYY